MLVQFVSYIVFEFWNNKWISIINQSYSYLNLWVTSFNMKNQQRLIIDKFRKSFSSLSLLKPSKKQKNISRRKVFFSLRKVSILKLHSSLQHHPRDDSSLCTLRFSLASIRRPTSLSGRRNVQRASFWARFRYRATATPSCNVKERKADCFFLHFLCLAI